MINMGLPNASSASNWVDDVRMRDVGDWRFLLVTACTVLSVLLLHALYVRLWKPYTTRRFYEKQGIKGPVFRPFVGNLPEIRALNASVPDVCGISEPAARRLGLEMFVFTEKYGKVSVYEHGSITRLMFSDPKLAKEVLVAKAGHYHKAALIGEVLNRVTGEGSIVVTEEGQWKEQNHIMSPAFRHNLLRDQFHYILESANELVTKWQAMINNSDEKYGAEVAIDLDLPETLLDIIIKTTFGSTTVEGEDIRAIHKAGKFMLRILGPRLSGYGRLFPGYGFLPTPTNIKVWIESRNVEKVLMNFVRARLKQVSDMKRMNPKATKKSIYGTNLLGMMLEAYEEGNSNMTKSQLLDQCKAMLIASDNPTSLLMIWTLTLLAMHPDWQERLRSEVQDVVGEGTPQPDTLSHLKLVDMVLNETMRLIPPVRTQNRGAIDDHQIGSVKVAAGTSVIIPLAVIHQSKDIWGEDAHLYNPERWSKSDSHNFSSFMPFGAGNRICLGRNLARMEAKLILSFLLRRFTFSVAPGYRHAPGFGDLILWPKYGVQLRIKNVAS